MVRRFEKCFQLCVQRLIQQGPIQLAFIMPFIDLAQLCTHKDQFFTRVHQNIRVERPHTGSFQCFIAGHLSHQRAFHMHHLIVGHRKHKILRKGIHKGKRHVPMIVLSEIGIELDVMGHIVHPAHIPFQIESQPAGIHRAGHHRPGRGFLRDHQHIGIRSERHAVEILQKGDGLQIFFAAFAVGRPLTVPAVIIEIQHGRHSIHSQSVNMILGDPVLC